MFETAEVGHRVDKEDYHVEVPRLRDALLDAQFEIEDAKKFPVVVIVGGVDGAGKGETVNLLNEWMDPRHIQNVRSGRADRRGARTALDVALLAGAARPRGRSGSFPALGTPTPIIDRASPADRRRRVRSGARRIVRFERMLSTRARSSSSSGCTSRRTPESAPRRARERPGDALARDEVGLGAILSCYDKFRSVSARRAAPHEHRPKRRGWWSRASDARYRRPHRRHVPSSRQSAPAAAGAAGRPGGAAAADRPSTAGTLLANPRPLAVAGQEEQYEEQLEEYAGRAQPALDPKSEVQPKRSAIVVFEGIGRGRQGRRDPAHHRRRSTRGTTAVIPIAAPTDEERAQPYLWRFWRHLPRRASVTIFDRSWYGRVLVERVEGFCAAERLDARVRRDQRLRGAARRSTDDRARQVLAARSARTSSSDALQGRARRRAFKRFKITDEDWRNRKKWDAYERAVVRHGRSHEHRDRAVDARRGERQALRADQGAQNTLQPNRRRPIGTLTALTGTAAGVRRYRRPSPVRKGRHLLPIDRIRQSQSGSGSSISGMREVDLEHGRTAGTDVLLVEDRSSAAVLMVAAVQARVVHLSRWIAKRL